MRLRTRIRNILLIFSSTLLGGALGYHFIEGWPFFDGLYMSIITVTTVGFSEVHPLTESGKLFTSFLILVGVGSITYTFGAIANYVVEGELQGFLGERRMKRLTSSMVDHVIVCGYGRMGHEICQELQREGRASLVVDEREDSYQQAVDDGWVALRADPGLDETLQFSGIHRAAALAAASDDDAKNLMVVISARGLNPTLPIVARVSAEDAPEKFIRAGANSVFLPYRTGGRRMAQTLVRPDVVGFLEDILHNESALGLNLENLKVQRGSELDGLSLRDARIRERTGAYVVGLMRPTVGIVHDLKPTTILEAEDTVIAMGKKDQLEGLAFLMANLK